MIIISLTLNLLSTADDNRNLFKSYTTLKSVSATLKADCSFIDPVFILATDNDVFNCNYVYCENTARFYFVRDREMLTGGRIGLHCHVDVLQSFNNAISSNMDAQEAQQRMDAANRSLDNAEFWSQSGDEFLSGNSYDEARRQLNGY